MKVIATLFGFAFLIWSMTIVVAAMVRLLCYPSLNLESFGLGAGIILLLVTIGLWAVSEWESHWP